MCIFCTWLMFNLRGFWNRCRPLIDFVFVTYNELPYLEVTYNLFYMRWWYIYICTYISINIPIPLFCFVSITLTFSVDSYNPFNHISWWRHQMETFSPLLTLCEGNRSVTGGFPSQRPVTQSFDVFFDQRLNKRLSKQSRRSWFETPLRSL